MLLLLLCSLFSTTVSASYNFSRATTCKNVQTSYPYGPITETSDFQQGETIYAWMEITNVYGSVKGKFEWIRPNGTLYSTSTTSTFNVSNGGWLRMYAPQLFYNTHGQWQVRFYISHNGGAYQLLDTKHCNYGGCVCPAVYDPVCGSDGNTYGNACEAQCAGVNNYTQGECNTGGTTCDLLTRITFNPDLCSQCLTEIAVYEYYGHSFLVYDGRNSHCSDAITTVVNCDSGATYCQEGGIAGLSCGSFFSVATKKEVILTDDCSGGCNCPAVVDPVCGSDGNTYNNACEAQCAGVSIANQGPCVSTCDLGIDYCNEAVRSASLYSYFYNGAYRTYVVEQPVLNPTDLPVVVKDCSTGQVFCTAGFGGSNCGNFFQSATEVRQIFNRDTDCDQGCYCPQVYDPVCGSDGKTYGNSCEAECAGVSWTHGACGSNNGCACTNHYADYFCDDFQKYSPSKLGPQSSCWTTWTGQEGGSKDGDVKRNNNTGNQYLKIKGNNPSGGGHQDVVLKLGDRTSGCYHLDFKIWLFSGDKGYYNVLHKFTPNGSNQDEEWACNVYFDGHGTGRLIVQNRAYSFTYRMGEWINVSQHFDLDYDISELKIDGRRVHRWRFSNQASTTHAGTRKLSAIDFYPVNSSYEFYIDEVEFKKANNLVATSENRGRLAEAFGGYETAASLVVAPNPFEHSIDIQIPEGIEKGELMISDQLGRVIRQVPNVGELSGQTLSLDVSDLESGIYIVRIATRGKIFTEKIVKQSL